MALDFSCADDLEKRKNILYSVHDVNHDYNVSITTWAESVF